MPIGTMDEIIRTRSAVISCGIIRYNVNVETKDVMKPTIMFIKTIE